MKFFGAWMGVTFAWGSCFYSLIAMIENQSAPIFWENYYRYGIIISTVVVSVVVGIMCLVAWWTEFKDNFQYRRFMRAEGTRKGMVK